MAAATLGKDFKLLGGKQGYVALHVFAPLILKAGYFVELVNLNKQTVSRLFYK